MLIIKTSMEDEYRGMLKVLKALNYTEIEEFNEYTGRETWGKPNAPSITIELEGE